MKRNEYPKPSILAYYIIINAKCSCVNQINKLFFILFIPYNFMRLNKLLLHYIYSIIV